MQLRNLVDPKSTVVVTMEVQEGIIGESSAFIDLHQAAVSSGVLSMGPQLCQAARRMGIPVIHATAVNRSDSRGTVTNCRMLAASKEMHGRGSGIIEGTEGAQLVSEFGPETEDIIISRLHGLTPFTSTSLDQTIRNLGSTTVIPVGVSINIGILGLVLSAVDLGYQVVIPTDAVAGVPIEYGKKVLDGTLSLLSTLTTTEEIISNWE
tara:strand:+ start:166 stop:789 length:624 start_codon:yes stop_codon:yes gene_type:complete